MLYLKGISQPSLATFTLTTSTMPHIYNSFKNGYFSWELDRLFSVWKSTLQQINDWIHVADTYSSTIILDNAYMAFFNDDYFGKMTTRVNEHLLAQFTFALEIKFDRALQFHDEDYESSDDYDLPKPLIRWTHIYLVSPSSDTIFNPIDYQVSTTPIPPLTPKWRQVELPLHLTVHKWLNFSDTPLLAADSNSDAEEEDFPTATLNDLV